MDKNLRSLLSPRNESQITFAHAFVLSPFSVIKPYFTKETLLEHVLKKASGGAQAVLSASELGSCGGPGAGLGFPESSIGKESACNVGDLGSIPGLGRSSGRERLPTPVFRPGEFHGLYSPQGHKEPD